MDPLTPDKASVVVMAKLALCNFLRLKSRDSYTPKGSVDEVQRNGLLLLVAWRESYWSKNVIVLDRAATRKRNLNAEKFQTLLLEYVHGAGQLPWNLKTVME